MNLHLLNDIRRLNEYMITCSDKTKSGGVLLGCFVPLQLNLVSGSSRRLGIQRRGGRGRRGAAWRTVFAVCHAADGERGDGQPPEHDRVLRPGRGSVQDQGERRPHVEAEPVGVVTSDDQDGPAGQRPRRQTISESPVDSVSCAETRNVWAVFSHVQKDVEQPLDS